MDPRPSRPRSGADARYTRSTRRSSARGSDARSLRRTQRAEGVRDRELWKPRARVRETAHAAAASFRRVAPVWHVRGAFAGLDVEVIERHVEVRIIQPMLAHASIQQTERNLQRDGRSTAA